MAEIEPPPISSIMDNDAFPPLPYSPSAMAGIQKQAMLPVQTFNMGNVVQQPTQGGGHRSFKNTLAKRHKKHPVRKGECLSVDNDDKLHQ